MNSDKKLIFEHYLPSDSSRIVMIALHGWKGNRHSFQPIARSLNIPGLAWYFVEGPYTVDSEENQKSWTMEISPGVWKLEDSPALLTRFLNEEIWPRYASENVLFMGFSQGAMMCYEFALLQDKPLGGVFPIAGFMHDTHEERQRIHPAQLHTPIIIGHGRNDDVVHLSESEFACRVLRDQGADPELLIYSGKHKIGIEYLRRIRKYLKMMGTSM